MPFLKCIKLLWRLGWWPSVWTACHESMKTRVWILTTHLDARWAWWPTWNPSAQGVETGDPQRTLAGWISQNSGLWVLWELPPQCMVRTIKKDTTSTLDLHTHTCTSTHVNMYIHIPDTHEKQLLWFGYKVSLKKAHVLKAWSPDIGAIESWFDYKGSNLIDGLMDWWVELIGDWA